MPRANWFWSVVSRSWANYGHVAIAAFIVNLLALAYPLFTMNVYDRVVPNAAIPSLVALAVGLCLAILFDFVLRTVRSRIIDMTGKKIDVVLAANIFEHVQAVKMAQRPQSVGILANQLRDFDSVREFFTSGTVVSATKIGSILMAEGQAGVSYNFGDIRPTGISGLVYEDTNDNGVLDSGEAASFLYYVMPFVSGESLRERLERVQQLPIDQTLAIAQQVAAALDHAHARNVIAPRREAREHHARRRACLCHGFRRRACGDAGRRREPHAW